MKKEIKIHYNPYANDFPADKRLPKTICGQKNNGNETHIKDGVTCSVCKRMFNNVDKFMNGGLQEILEDENRIKHMSFEEMENYERVNILNQQDKYNRFNIVDKNFYIQGEKVIAYTSTNKFLGESIPGKKSKSTILEMVGDKLIFLYGKYKGMDLKDIEDMKYLTWVTTLYKVKSGDRKLIKKFIKTKTGETKMEEIRISFMSEEEFFNHEHISMGYHFDRIPLTKKQQKEAEMEFNGFLREVFGPDAGPNDDVYLSDGMYLTPDGEMVCDD